MIVAVANQKGGVGKTTLVVHLGSWLSRQGYRVALVDGDPQGNWSSGLMDGALAPTESVSKYFHADTPLAKEKNLIKVFKEIRDYISKRLENLTLSDLV